MTQRQDQKRQVNEATKIVGFLGHDNYLWDMRCPSCRRMESHFKRNICPKCGTPLVWLTKGDGSQTMAISEGTIYPLLTDKEKERYEKFRSAVGGLKTVHRFKIFSFGPNATTPPPLPDNHENMKKGALVKLMIINHEPVYKLFTSKTEGQMLEVSYPIFKEYGDKVEVIEAPRARAVAGTAPSAPTTGNTPAANIEDLQTQIAQMQQMLAMIQSQIPQAQPTPPAQVDQINNQISTTVIAEDGTEIPMESLIDQMDEDDCPF